VAEILILGLGNSILSDDGLGGHAVARLLERYDLPAGVAALDGGTLGLHLLPHLEGVRDLLLIDTVRGDEQPGTLIRLEDDAIPSALAPKLSLHQAGLIELLAVSEALGSRPERVVLWGMTPSLIGLGLDLSVPVAAGLDPLVERVVAELRAWGVAVDDR
jgi:hydrogenase maturation protease